MSSFTPTNYTLEPPDRPDYLARAVSQSLARQVFGRLKPWRPIKTLVLGALTFGIWPLISWPKIFGRFVIGEQQQFWHLADWLHLRTGDPQAAQLRDSTPTSGPSRTLFVIPLICLIVVGISFVHASRHALALNTLFAATYRYTFVAGALRHISLTTLNLYWTLCIGFAYFSIWLHILEHAGNTDRFVQRLNAVLVSQHVQPVGSYPPGLGLRPLWIGLGVLGGILGVWWAIPAALAGGLLQRYMRYSSPRIRFEMSQRVQTLLARNGNQLEPADSRWEKCQNELCRAHMPQEADFCPRCGAPTGNT